MRSLKKRNKSLPPIARFPIFFESATLYTSERSNTITPPCIFQEKMGVAVYIQFKRMIHLRKILMPGVKQRSLTRMHFGFHATLKNCNGYEVGSDITFKVKTRKEFFFPSWLEHLRNLCDKKQETVFNNQKTKWIPGRKIVIENRPNTNCCLSCVKSSCFTRNKGSS